MHLYYTFLFFLKCLFFFCCSILLEDDTASYDDGVDNVMILWEKDVGKIMLPRLPNKDDYEEETILQELFILRFASVSKDST